MQFLSCNPHRLATHTLALILLGVSAAPALAHDGRRFEIEVIDSTLFAQGVNTVTNFGPDGTTVIDPAGPRPYRNAIHSHWDTILSTQFTDLPGYDAGHGTEALASYDVFLTLTGASKWTDVSNDFVAGTPMITPGTVPDFQPLADDESITIEFTPAGSPTAQQVTTDDLGTANPTTLELITDFDGVVSFGPDGLANATTSNGFDRDVDYIYQSTLSETTDTLYRLEFVLSTNAPGVEDSGTVYTLISPDGSGPFQRLHFASLYTEDFLGSTLIPEPASLGTLVAGLLLAARRRRLPRID